MSRGAVSLRSSEPKTGIASLIQHVRWEHLAAGVSGGVVSTVILHPLDLIKIRFQVSEGAHIATDRPQYRGVVNAFSTITKNEGIRGLYQGVTPNVWGAGASWGLYFLFYNCLKQRKQEKEGITTLSPGQHMLAAAEAGVFTLAITNPIWVAKTRLCLQYESGTTQGVDVMKKNNAVHYRGMFDCLLKIFRAEGFSGLYKGFTPGMIGVSHGALQFMAYEELKKMYNKHRNLPLDTKFSTAEYLSFAAVSKVFAASTTYPYQVVRSRLQDQHRSYNGALDVVTQTWKNEGVLAFYKGLFPSLLRVTPACCITFIVYEKMTATLR